MASRAAKVKTKKIPQKAAVYVTPGKKETSGQFRVRVRMYRQGLGDCFLITFPRETDRSFNMLIDCGALGRDKKFMTRIVEHIEETVKVDGKGRLDLVVATHEHKDHLSGFNQAREVFNRIDIGGVWLGWTENLTQEDAKKIKEAKKTALDKLRAALDSPFGIKESLAGVSDLLEFSAVDDKTGTGRISEALDYLKLRGKDAGALKFLEPGEGPLSLDGVAGVRVYALGPPHDPLFLKTSAVTEQMKSDDIVYHLGRTGFEGMDAISAAISATDPSSSTAAGERYHPFAIEHRISRQSIWFPTIEPYISGTYDAPDQKWRQIEDDWLGAFGQLALDLDNDTNNTSLVLAFELVKTGEVLLFVGDAQVGNWKSWEKVSFKVPGEDRPLPASDLLRRTIFYKVGHHCSHNATTKKGGLERMENKNLVAFIPLDKDTAAQQGRKDKNGKPTGWDMRQSHFTKRCVRKRRSGW